MSAFDNPIHQGIRGEGDAVHHADHRSQCREQLRPPGRRCIFLSLSILPLLFATSGIAQLPGYEILVLDENLGTHSPPELSEPGAVVWSVAFPPDAADVFLFADGVTRRISTEAWYDVLPALNDSLLVPWMRCESFLDEECELATYFEGTRAVLPIPFALDLEPSVNASGLIVWGHDFSGTFDDVQLLLYDTRDGTCTQITDNGLVNQGARINAQGDVAWTRYDFTVSPWQSTIMLYSGGDTLELTDGAGEPQSADINDLGQVVYSCGYGCQALGLYQWEEGITTLLVEDPGTAVPQINNLGRVAYNRWDDSSEKWDIWVYDEGESLRISDLPYWSTSPSINDDGAIAWRTWNQATGVRETILRRRNGAKADFNNDCRIDLRDFQAFQVCFAGAGAGRSGGLLGSCARGDLDENGQVDLADYQGFASALGGPVAAIPLCAP